MLKILLVLSFIVLLLSIINFKLVLDRGNNLIIECVEFGIKKERCKNMMYGKDNIPTEPMEQWNINWEEDYYEVNY